MSNENEEKKSQVKLDPNDLSKVSGGKVKDYVRYDPLPEDPEDPDGPNNIGAVVCSKCKKPLAYPDELNIKMCRTCAAQFKVDFI